MPKYIYRCESCDQEFEAIHGMDAKLDVCILCKEFNTIVRVPQMLFHKRITDPKKPAVGDAVKEAIEENAKILKDQKKDAQNEEWKP